MTKLLDDVMKLLPEDHAQATLVGRAWLPANGSNPGGPALVRVSAESVFDMTAFFPTLADLLGQRDPAMQVHGLTATSPLASFADIARNTLASRRDESLPFFISPVDLQPVKACGVTFHDSLVERIIEERAEGNKQVAERIRKELLDKLGEDFNSVIPGSSQALALLELLKHENLWSQYLEVGLGSDAEIFTKASPLASVGTGAEIGILPVSKWNNPEPELSLVINARAEIAGAMLGNDVNHRDIEGRSALLLGRAKDNNAACALGPFIRMLDSSFDLDALASLEVLIDIEGVDGYRLQDRNNVTNIRRPVAEIVSQCIGPCNDYPDGVVLMLGAMFSPTQDRDEAGAGFTHKIGDVVRISSPALGTLVNRVQRTDRIAHRHFGVRDLMFNLAQRGCLHPES